MLIFAPDLVQVGSVGGAIVPTEYPGPACRQYSVATVQESACRSPVCVVVTPPSTVRPKGPATGRLPASPVFYLDLFLPPKPARSRPGRGSRTSCSATTVSGADREGHACACQARCRRLVLCWEEGTHIGVLRERDSGCHTGGWRSEGAGMVWPWPPGGPSWALVAVVQLHPSGSSQLDRLPRAVLLARPGGARGASEEDGDRGGAGPVTQLAGRGSPATGPLHNLRRVTPGARGRRRGGERGGADASRSFARVFLPLLYFSVILCLPAQSPTCLLEYMH